MFNSLREKLSGWFKGKEEKVEEKPKKETKKKEKKEIKKPKKSNEKLKKIKSEIKSVEEEIKKEKELEESVEEKLKKKADEIEEEVPVEFNAGKQKFEPNVEKIKENEEELKEVEEEKEVKEEVKESFFGKLKKKVGFGKEEIKKVEERAEELEEKLEEATVEKHKAEKEPIEKAEVEEEIEEKKGFFGRLAKKLTTSELKSEEFNEMFEEFEFSLLENNVALSVVDKIKENLSGALVGKKFGNKEVEEKILEALKKSIDSVLIEGEDFIERIKNSGKEPFVILFFGINGSGKTTSIAKLAWKLKNAGIEPVLAAGDTFRAASIEQLETHANKIGVEIVKSDYGKDPAAVAFDAIAYAKKNHKKVVLIDTAGRMYTKSNLMKEMEKIVKVSNPDLKVFVGESITGNDATEQAKMFNETAGIDGIILSKADVDEKAGSILSVSFVTGKPILFLGVGQEYSDLEEFKKKNVLKNLGLE